MHRTLIVLFRRDPERDAVHGEIPVEGYQISSPDGRAVAVGLKAFCKHGLRLLGLKGCLNRCSERLVELLCFPVLDGDDPAVLTWIGLPALPEGERQWLDLAARGLDADAVPAGLRPLSGNEVLPSGRCRAARADSQPGQ
jgi:hypothetical protein